MTDELELSHEDIRKLLEQREKHKQYMRNRYYNKKYGQEVPFERARDVRVRDEVTLRYAVRPSVNPGAYVFLKDGTRISGAEGWYTKGYTRTGRMTGTSYQHVGYGEELVRTADALPTWIWDRIRPDHCRPNTLPRNDAMDAMRHELVEDAVERWGQWYFRKHVDSLTFGELIALPRTDRYVNVLEGSRHAFRLYLEGVNLRSLSCANQLSETVANIIERGRQSWEMMEKDKPAILERARWIRDRVAQEFGFQYNVGRQCYFRDQVVVELDGSVHIGKQYICIVPLHYYHQDHGADDFPIDDIVAAKMATLGTDARDQIYTLKSHLGYLRNLFRRKEKKNEGQADGDGPSNWSLN
jgi:hypothetical protein